jgi:hypothetical protein
MVSQPLTTVQSNEVFDASCTLIINKIASANIRNSHDAEATSKSAVYIKVKTILFPYGLPGQFRALFDIKTSNVAVTAYGKIYKNVLGVESALGAEQSSVSAVYETKSEDITFTANPGDALELWIHCDGAETVSVQNFRIAYDDDPIVPVASVNS